MTKKMFTLEVISPMFLNGADTRQPEMRAASVRGQLRYWLRAIIGASTDNQQAIWQRESAVFGSTGQGSAVTIRVFPHSLPLDIRDSQMLPHKPNDRERSPQKAIQPGQKTTLELVTRPGVNMPDDAIHALYIWSLLGGLGKRSRRTFGAFMLSGDDTIRYSNPQELEEQIKKSLISAKCDSRPARSNIPDFPSLDPNHCAVLVGHENQYSDHVQAEKDLFGLLHQTYVIQRMFGFAGYDNQDKDVIRSLNGRDRREFEESLIRRRASLLIAQVRRIDAKLYPIFTFFRSQPTQISSTRKIDWKMINQFMGDVKRKFKAEFAWGGEFK